MTLSPALTYLPLFLLLSAQALACSSSGSAPHSDQNESSLCTGADCEESAGGAGGEGNVIPEGEGSPAQTGCTLIGCGPALEIGVPLNLDFEAIQDLRIELCRNDICLSGTLADLREPTRPDEGFGVALDPGDGMTHPFVDATIWLADNQGYQLGVSWWPYSHGELQDGDRYVLALTQADGTALVQLNETVDYAETFPNGVDCDVIPCRSAALEVDP